MSNLDERFKHHPPTSLTVQNAHEALRDASRTMAEVIESICPDGREKALALTKTEEAMFWANAAVARAQQVGEG